MRFESEQVRDDVAAARNQGVVLRVAPDGRAWAPALQLRPQRGAPMVACPRYSSGLRHVGTGVVNADGTVLLWIDGEELVLPPESVVVSTHANGVVVRIPRDLFLRHMATAEERDVAEQEQSRVARGLDSQSLNHRRRMAQACAYLRRLELALDSADDVEYVDENVDGSPDSRADPDPPPDDPTNADALARPARVGQAPGRPPTRIPVEVAVPA